MALFGLSPLALSFVASTWFTDPLEGLNVTHFTSFLAIVAFATHLIGGVALQIVPPASRPTILPHTLPTIDEEDGPDERTALFAKPAVEYLELPPGNDGSIGKLVGDVEFWVLALASLIILGTVRLSTN